MVDCATPATTKKPRHFTRAQRLANSARALRWYYKQRAAAIPPDPERARLEVELKSLRREAAAIERAITHLEKQLAASSPA